MISLFVRSYEKDFEWLSYSVKSMRVNLLGSVTEKVLVVPVNTQIPIDIAVSSIRLSIHKKHIKDT